MSQFVNRKLKLRCGNLNLTVAQQGGLAGQRGEIEMWAVREKPLSDCHLVEGVLLGWKGRGLLTLIEGSCVGGTVQIHECVVISWDCVLSVGFMGQKPSCSFCPLSQIFPASRHPH